MHKGKKHSIKEGYENFARSEQAEAEKYVDSVKTNNPFGEGLDSVVDEEARRRETGYYVKGTTISKGKKTDTPDLSEQKTPLYAKMTCWKGYKAKGKKPSPSGKKTKSGKIKMVNNCVKK
jgi:hypothetical protein|tara:strand:+ start:24 stop:383 length:360 start_codon:yes stop_codon:yes gene_type:complete